MCSNQRSSSILHLNLVPPCFQGSRAFDKMFRTVLQPKKGPGRCSAQSKENAFTPNPLPFFWSLERLRSTDEVRGHCLPRDTGRSHLSQDRRGNSMPRLGSTFRLPSPPAFNFPTLPHLRFFQCPKQKFWHYPQPPSFGLAGTVLTSICVTENILLHGNGSSKLKHKGGQ